MATPLADASYSSRTTSSEKQIERCARSAAVTPSVLTAAGLACASSSRRHDRRQPDCAAKCSAYMSSRLHLGWRIAQAESTRAPCRPCAQPAESSCARCERRDGRVATLKAELSRRCDVRRVRGTEWWKKRGVRVGAEGDQVDGGKCMHLCVEFVRVAVGAWTTCTRKTRARNPGRVAVRRRERAMRWRFRRPGNQHFG
eukprot:2215274-Pleurochrysis_carterae.AAC.4